MLPLNRLLIFCVFSLLHQSMAVFTPLIVILLFTFLKKSERGDLKEASLGEKRTAALKK